MTQIEDSQSTTAIDQDVPGQKLFKRDRKEHSTLTITESGSGSGQSVTRVRHETGGYFQFTDTIGGYNTVGPVTYSQNSESTISVSDGEPVVAEISEVRLQSAGRLPLRADEADPLRSHEPDEAGREGIWEQLRNGSRELAALGVALDKSGQRVGALSAQPGVRPESWGRR